MSHPVAGEAHDDDARAFQPVRHAQSADIEWTQIEALDEFRHAGLRPRVVAGHEDVQLPACTKTTPKMVLNAFTTLASTGATLAISRAIDVSAGMARPSPSALKGLMMSTMTLPARASPYSATTAATLAHSSATMTMSPAGTAPKSPVVALPPRSSARAAALDRSRPMICWTALRRATECYADTFATAAAIAGVLIDNGIPVDAGIRPSSP